MKSLYSGRYWAWCGFITLTTIWGGVYYTLDLDFWWGVVGAVVLILIAQGLREWDRRAAANPSHARADSVGRVSRSTTAGRTSPTASSDGKSA